MPTLLYTSKKNQTDATAGIWHAGLFFILGCLTVFALAKPYHMDDRGFLEAARHILENFPHLYTGTRMFEGKPFPWALFPHPPFVPMYLAGWMSVLKNPGPVALHLVFLPFPFLAAFSLYRVAKRCEIPPRWATLLFLASPCFFVSAQSLMTDVPMIAFFLTALALYLEGSSKNDTRISACSGLVACLAWFCRYPGILVVAVLFFHALLTKRWKQCLVASALPLGTFVLWTLATGHASGQSHVQRVFFGFLNAFYHPFAPQALGGRIIAFLSFLGGSIVFPPILLALLLLRRPIASCIPGIAAVLALGILWMFARGLSCGEILFGGACLAAGSAVLGIRAKNYSLPTLWLIGVFVLLVLMTPFATVRYLLPILPAACLVIVACIPQNVLRMLLILGAFLPSLLLSWVDMEVARGYRNIAQDLCRRKTESANKLYFSGEWGWRQALDQGGAAYWKIGAKDFHAGDLLAIPQEACPSLTTPPSKDWRLVQKMDLRISIPFHLMNYQSHAGFYSHGWGFLPYAYGKLPSDTIALYRYEPHG